MSFPIIEPGFGLGQPAAAIATSVFAALAMVQAAIAAAVVYRVVQDPTRDIRMALWLLSGIVISGPMLNSWSGYLGLADTNLSLPFMITVAATFTNAVLIAVRGGLVCLNSVARSDKWNHATVG